jgi:hypothetical protein
MAGGGWVYKSFLATAVKSGSYAGTAEHVDKIAGMFTSSGQGWTVSRATSQYGSYSAYCVLSHTGGAQLAVGYGPRESLADTVTDRKAFEKYSTEKTHVRGLWTQYLPPLQGGDGFPAAWGDWVSQMPARALPMMHVACGTNYISSEYGSDGTAKTNATEWHFGIKGDSFWHLSIYDALGAPAYGRFYVMGKILSPLEHGTSSLAPYAAVGRLLNPASSTSVTTGSDRLRASFFRERDGVSPADLRPRNYLSDNAVAFSHNLLASANLSAPAANNQIRWGAYAVYADNADAASEGVVNGSNVRGAVDPDVMRAVRPADVVDGQLLAGGDMIHLFGGHCVGWSALNPAFRVMTEEALTE